MNALNMNRLRMMLRWNYLDNKKSFLRALAVCILLFSAFSLLTEISTRLDPYTMTYEHILAIRHNYVHSLVSCYVWCCIMVWVVSGATIFRNMRSKQSRATYLLLPASSLEKYLARWIWVTVSPLVIAAVTFFSTDLLQYVLGLALRPGLESSMTVYMATEGLSDFFSYTNAMAAVLIVGIIVFFQSAFVLGGTFYRKHPVLLTMVTMYICSMVFGLMFLVYDEAVKSDSALLEYVSAVLIYGAVLLDYWQSYLLFRSTPVIGRKWVNLPE